MENIPHELYKSLCKKYEAEIQEAKSILLIYFEKAVGISDHPNHLDEMDILLKNLTEADEKLKMIQRVFNPIYSKL